MHGTANFTLKATTLKDAQTEALERWQAITGDPTSELPWDTDFRFVEEPDLAAGMRASVKQEAEEETPSDYVTKVYVVINFDKTTIDQTAAKGTD